jgi:hypothetical protein
MTDKTAIEKIRSLKRNAENDMPEYDYGWDAALDKATEALAAIEAEKPAEDAEEVAISIANLFSAYTLRNGKHLPASVEAAQLLVNFAESYHAEQCQICKHNELPDFARFENLSGGTTDVDK